MKKLKDFFSKMEREKVGTGILAIVAVIAIYYEMKLANFETSSIAGAIKDIAGVVMDIIVLFLALNIFKAKRKTGNGFEKNFVDEMKTVIKKYNPLICEDEEKGRYRIADDMSVLYQNIECHYDRLFDFNYEKGEIDFFVHKKLFMGRSKEDFTDKQNNIIKDITEKIKSEYSQILEEKHKLIDNGFKLKFKEKLINKNDAIKAAEIIDKIILLYIVEYKK